jgi:histidinol dehydrogenase
MNALPARVAGVDRLAMVVPAPSGNLSPLVLAAARIAEVDEIYRLGGAQAIGALAYGTATIAPVDKIVGPGNAYVAAAKRRVFGTVGIDMIAGPSEVLVVADGANDPRWIAADLLAQAEHDPSAQAILITDDKEFANAVVEAVDQHLDTLSRAEIARESWRRFGAVLTVSDQDEAVELIDRLAPEHLELPTSRSARFSSGLGVQDFIKRSTFIGCDAEVLAKLGPAARTLAEAEGLSAHALSLSIRLEQRGKD